MRIGMEMEIKFIWRRWDEGINTSPSSTGSPTTIAIALGTELVLRSLGLSVWLGRRRLAVSADGCLAVVLEEELTASRGVPVLLLLSLLLVLLDLLEVFPASFACWEWKRKEEKIWVSRKGKECRLNWIGIHIHEIASGEYSLPVGGRTWRDRGNDE